MILIVKLNGAVLYSITKCFFQVEAVLKGNIVKSSSCKVCPFQITSFKQNVLQFCPSKAGQPEIGPREGYRIKLGILKIETVHLHA